MDKELGPGVALRVLHKHVCAQTRPRYQGGHTVYVRPPTLRHTGEGGGANPSLLCYQLPSLSSTPALRIKGRVKRLCIKASLSRRSALFYLIGPGWIALLQLYVSCGIMLLSNSTSDSKTLPS